MELRVYYLEKSEVAKKFTFLDKIEVGIYEDFVIDFEEITGNLTTME